jgi:hypothetical protein
MPVAREFRWQLSKRQWAYLGWLVKNTSLGRTEKDVAQYLLNQKIQEMRLAYYAEPQPEGTEVDTSDDAAAETGE